MAVDEKKLAQLIHETRPVPSQAFDARITRQVQGLVREKIVMKKKISVLAICIALILSLALFGAVAELMGYNLFEMFGKDDKRLTALAPKAMLDEVSTITMENTDLGKTAAVISSAYYDGTSLLVAFTIGNAQRMEVYTPTAEQLAAMAKDINPPIVAIIHPEIEGPAIQWNQAIKEGKPFGYVTYAISPSDHTLTADGIDLPPSSENSQADEGGTLHTIREYESPLPDAAQNHDMLRIQIALSQMATYRYFDGNDVYTASTHQKLDPMTASIWRADAEVLRFEAEGSYLGHPVTAKVTASAAAAQVKLKMDGGMFPNLPDDFWYSLYLRDENQTELLPLDCDDGGTAQMTFNFNGTGQAPKLLELQLRIDHESDVASDASYEERLNITLEPMQ